MRQNVSNAGHTLREWQKDYIQEEVLQSMFLLNLGKKLERGNTVMRQQGTSSVARLLALLLNHSSSNLLIQIKMTYFPFRIISFSIIPSLIMKGKNKLAETRVIPNKILKIKSVELLFLKYQILYLETQDGYRIWQYKKVISTSCPQLQMSKYLFNWDLFT